MDQCIDSMVTIKGEISLTNHNSVFICIGPIRAHFYLIIDQSQAGEDAGVLTDGDGGAGGVWRQDQV